MRRLILTMVAGAIVAAVSGPQARATVMCSSSLVVGCTGDGLTFLGDVTTANQSNATVASDVQAFLKGLGFTGPLTYLGRQDGSGMIDGDGISIIGSASGTWTFSPGTTDAVASFIAMHAGNGQTDEVFEINSPSASGDWATFNGKSISNFDLFDAPAPRAVPEPTSLALVGSALAGLAITRRRRFTRH